MALSSSGSAVLVAFALVGLSAASVGFVVGTTVVCSPAWLLLAVAVLLAGAGGVSALTALARLRERRRRR